MHTPQAAHLPTPKKTPLHQETYAHHHRHQTQGWVAHTERHSTSATTAGPQCVVGEKWERGQQPDFKRCLNSQAGQVHRTASGRPSIVRWQYGSLQPASRSGRHRSSSSRSRVRGQWLASVDRQTAPKGHGQHVLSFIRPCPRWSEEPPGQTPAWRLKGGPCPSRPYGRRQHQFLANWISCRRGRAPRRRRSQGALSQS